MSRRKLADALTGVVVAAVVAGVIVDNAERGGDRTSAEEDDALQPLVEKEELERPDRRLVLKSDSVLDAALTSSSGGESGL